MRYIIYFVIIPSILFSVDPPHWSSVSIYEDCTSTCHTSHSSLGSPLTQAESNVNSCLSCHNSTGTAQELPISQVEEADPGNQGRHHSFNKNAIKPDYGAEIPQNNEMALRIMGSKVVCSTCHNQHNASQSIGGKPRISQAKKIAGSGTGTLSSSGVYNGTNGNWYLVEIDSPGSQATATFRWSKDNGISWIQQGVNCGDGNPVILDNGVYVTFSGGASSFQVGDRWEFYGSYPFLRIPMDLGDNSSQKFCRDCHRSWTMTHTEVESYDGNIKSHPIGIGLNANGKGYDRASPLDGNGNPQGGLGEDGIVSNNYKMDSSGNLQCYTCHNVHYADSNTLTEDLP